MEKKKKSKVNMEKHKGLFLQIGFVMAIALALAAFEWTTTEKGTRGLGKIVDVKFEDEQIPITQHNRPKPNQPQNQTQIAQVVEIVKDDIELDNEMEAMDMGADLETEIEAVEIPDETVEDEIFFIVEVMPKFPGGELALRKYVAQNIRYPNAARENDIQGKVYVRFVVNEDGTVGDVTILRGVDPLLDNEAVRVIKTLPVWQPGRQLNKTVKVYYTMPISFKLQD